MAVARCEVRIARGAPGSSTPLPGAPLAIRTSHLATALRHRPLSLHLAARVVDLVAGAAGEVGGEVVDEPRIGGGVDGERLREGAGGGARDDEGIAVRR